MHVEWQWIVNALMAVVLTGLGWFARELWGAVKELRLDLAKLREELPKEYTAKEDFREGVKEIKDMLGRIFDRLDSKADK